MRQEHGPKIITLGSNIISERAAQAIEAQPLRRTVHLAELNLIDDTKIEYKGAQIKISKSGFSDLLKILKIPQAFIKRFGEMMSEKPEAKRQFINTIKNVMSGQGSGASTVTLVLSRSTREILAVHKTERNLISNAGFLDVVNSQGEEVLARFGDFGADDGGKHHGVIDVDQHSAAGLAGDFAGFQGDRVLAPLKCFGDFVEDRHVWFLVEIGKCGPLHQSPKSLSVNDAIPEKCACFFWNDTASNRVSSFAMALPHA